MAEMTVFYVSKNSNATKMVSCLPCSYRRIIPTLFSVGKPMQCAPTTLDFYKYTTGVFLNWIEGQSVTAPEQVGAPCSSSSCRVGNERQFEQNLARSCASHSDPVSLLVRREVHSQNRDLCQVKDGNETTACFINR